MKGTSINLRAQRFDETCGFKLPLCCNMVDPSIHSPALAEQARIVILSTVGLTNRIQKRIFSIRAGI